MPSLNFKPQFVEPIRKGVKKHTIRAKRKRPIKVGDSLSLYSGMRTKECFPILPEPVTCTRVEPIEIGVASVRGVPMVTMDDRWLEADERERLAVSDGFEDFEQMMQFWEGRLPFGGNIIHWR